MPLRSRTYGNSGPFVFLLHGGPGAPGSMAAVARRLADGFRIVEPFQRKSGQIQLTVARHVADLNEVIELNCPAFRPALVGSSWGAMLALAFAAAHPDRAGPLVLIGCGTFDHAARDRFRENLRGRMNDRAWQRVQNLAKEVSDPNERLRTMHELVLPYYAHDLLTTDLEIEWYDARGHDETWRDMVRLQEEGLYPAAFEFIESPVLMLHGSVDPHPGQMIRTALEACLPQLEYHEWELCGHYPWLEKAVQDEFFTTLRAWLTAKLRENEQP